MIVIIVSLDDNSVLCIEKTWLGLERGQHTHEYL